MSYNPTVDREHHIDDLCPLITMGNITRKPLVARQWIISSSVMSVSDVCDVGFFFFFFFFFFLVFWLFFFLFFFLGGGGVYLAKKNMSVMFVLIL